MSENRDPRITDAMADAAEEAHSEHDPTIREAENGLWHWFCTCRSGRDESAATDEDTCLVEMRRHEYRAMVAAALTARQVTAPAVIDSWSQLWCRTCGNRYAEHVDVDLCSCGGELQAVTLQLVAREA